MGQANTSADDVKAFGKVPVFYNGRVTTHEQVAQSLLFRITAEENLEIKVSGEDKPLSASLWLLDVLANHKRFRTYRIFDVSNELKMLMGTENQQGRVNFDQLSKVRKVIGEAFNKQQDTNSAELIVNGIKLDRGSLAQTLQSLEWIEEINFFHQTELDPQRMADMAISSMRYPIPLYAPPPGDGFEWETAVFADVFDQVKKSKRREIALFKDILRSHREDQAEDFSKAVQAYSEIIKKADFPTPLSFSVPKGWKEVNNPRGMNLEYFNDFNGFGMPIASFHCGPEFKCMGGLACVVDATGSMIRSVNNERFIAGLLPLPEKELLQKLKNVEIAGHQGSLFVHENVTPQTAGNMSVQVGFQVGKLTWAASIFGPKESVNSERENFEKFCATIKLDNVFFEKVMERRKRAPNPNPNLLTVYVCSIKDQTFVIRLHEMRKRNAEFDSTVMGILESISLESLPAKNAREIGWKLPNDWKQDATGTIVVGDFKAYAVCDILKGKADTATQERIADLLKGLGGMFVLDGDSESLESSKLNIRKWKMKPAQQ